LQGLPPSDARRAGPFFTGVRMKSWSDYSNYIRLSVSNEALYLAAILPFRIGHPTLCIPWKEIDLDRRRRSPQHVFVLLGKQEHIPLRLAKRIDDKLGISQRFPQGTPTA